LPGTQAGDGKEVGEAVGNAVGKAVGDAVGATVGTADGNAVGEVVGWVVGTAVGNAVGISTQPSRPSCPSVHCPAEQAVHEEKSLCRYALLKVWYLPDGQWAQFVWPTHAL